MVAMLKPVLHLAAHSLCFTAEISPCFFLIPLGSRFHFFFHYKWLLGCFEFIASKSFNVLSSSLKALLYFALPSGIYLGSTDGCGNSMSVLIVI